MNPFATKLEPFLNTRDNSKPRIRPLVVAVRLAGILGIGFIRFLPLDDTIRLVLLVLAILLLLVGLLVDVRGPNQPEGVQ